MIPVTSGATPSHRNPSRRRTPGSSGADRHQQEDDDDERAQQVDQREQVLLAVARAEQAEHVGADRVEQADQPSALAATPAPPAKLQVRRQVRGDEHSWKPQAKNASVMKR